MKKIVLLFLILFFGRMCFAESGTSVFIIDSIHEIRLTFTQNNFWDTLTYNYEIKHVEVEESVDPIIAKMTFDGTEVDSIGVKLKANFSYSIPSKKKPIKLDFNAFVKGKKFDGLKALNLLNEFPDPTLLRNTVAYKVLREAGVDAPRTSFAKVYLNDVYWGLYVLVEQIDKTFIVDHFNREGAELVKALASSLFYQDLDTMSFYSAYEIKVKDRPESWAHLIELGRRVNKTSAENFHDSLKLIFDFENYLKVFAADIVFNNWDSYFYGQNYYLMRDSIEGKYYYLPWDYNLSLNVYEVSGGNFDILPGGANNHFFNLPLPQKVCGNKYLRKKYLEEVKRINKLMFDQTDFIVRMNKKLRPELLLDTGKVFSITQYDKSLSQQITISDVPTVGLLSFIRSRNIQVKEALEKIKKED